MAPDFELMGSDGVVYKLSDFIGKKAIVIAWFPKAFTGGWTPECNSPRASDRARALIVELEGGREIELRAAVGLEGRVV